MKNINEELFDSINYVLKNAIMNSISTLDETESFISDVQKVLNMEKIVTMRGRLIEVKNHYKIQRENLEIIYQKVEHFLQAKN